MTTKKSPSSDDIHATLNNYGQNSFPDPLSGSRHSEDEVIHGNDSSNIDDSDDNEEGSMSTSTPTSYRDEWIRLFECEYFDSFIRREGLKGRLRTCRFRSLCWRVFLKCLSPDVSKWSSETKKSRARYENLLHRVLTSPETDLKDKSLDVTLNNPLSQAEDSPWNLFFQDKLNKQEIYQDVIRCFPEIAFFQKKGIQKIMLNILFCYAKEHPEVCYKQGMHEVLAPLIFVLHSDQQAYLHAKEMESHLVVGPDTRPLVGELLDTDFLEHDSFTMFSNLMETMKPWYEYRQTEFEYGKKSQLSKPFSKDVEPNPSSPLVNKIQRIQDDLLQKSDFELYSHLTRLEIQPQVYGIRWVRLLFGREFTLQDLLLLWDSFFADDASLDLLDYFFVAMLMLVRELLLVGDVSDCLNLLMHFPTSEDIHFLINKAFHLRDPLKHSRPANYQFQIFHQSRTGDYMAHTMPRMSDRRTSQNSISLREKTNAAMSSGFSSLKRITQNTGINKSRLEQGDITNRMVKSRTYGDLPHPLSQSPKDDIVVESKPVTKRITQISNSSSNSVPVNNRVEYLFGKPKNNNTKGQDKEVTAVQQQIDTLQGRMNDTQNMCRYCATKMEAHILQIQDALESHKLPEDDNLLMALAGLKQVKDILGGTLKFAQGISDGEEIRINDNYFSEESEAGLSIKHFDKSRETFLQEKEELIHDQDPPDIVNKSCDRNGHVRDGGDLKPQDLFGIN